MTVWGEEALVYVGLFVFAMSEPGYWQLITGNAGLPLSPQFPVPSVRRLSVTSRKNELSFTAIDCGISQSLRAICPSKICSIS